jgi:SHS2 domain-containing protein
MEAKNNEFEELTEEQENFMVDHINDLTWIHKREVLMMIKYGMDNKYILSKGTGTQIFLDNIPLELKHMVYNYINAKIREQKEDMINSDI